MHPLNMRHRLVPIAAACAISAATLILFITEAPAQGAPESAATAPPSGSQTPAPDLPEVQVIQENEALKPVEQVAPKPKEKSLSQSSSQASAAKPSKKAETAGPALPPEAAAVEQDVDSFELPPGIRLEPTFGTNIQSTTAGDVIGYRALTSTSATKTGTSIAETPQSIQVLPRELLDDQAVASLQDATKNVSGISGTSTNYDNNNGSCVRMRGFSTDQNGLGCVYYLDGVRILGLPIPFAAVERIEVIKGPNTVLFGRNEPGGMINVVTKAPRFDDNIQMIEQTVGSFGTSITAVDFGGILDTAKTLAARFNAAYSTTDSFRDGAFSDIGNVNAALAWQPSAGTRIDVAFDYIKQIYEPDFGIPALGNRPAPVPISQSYKQDYIDSSLESSRLTVKLDQKLDDGWKLNASYFYSYVEPRVFNVFGTGLDETNNTLTTAYFFDAFSWRHTHQANVDLKGDVQIGGLRHRPIVGFDFNYERYDGPYFFDDASAPPIDLFNPDLSSAPRLYPTRADTEPFGLLQKWYGVFAHDTVDLTDKLSVNFGVRHDLATGGWDADPVGNAVTERATKPRVGAVYEAIPGLHLFAQYQEAFGPTNGRSATGEPFKGETAISYETGAKWTTPDNSFLVSVALYHLRKQNILAGDPSTPDPFDNIAIGEVRNRGIEVDMSGRLTDQLSIIASYTYSDAITTKDERGYQGLRYEGVPDHAGSIWLRYQLDKNWAFGAGAFAEDARAGDLGNTYVLPGYVRFDAMAQYRFLVDATRWTAQLNVNNVFDTEWYVGSYKNSREYIMPGTPAAAYFSLKSEF